MIDAILVCVDYWDYLEVSLPYNRHHFNNVFVVTAPRDGKTCDIAHNNDCVPVCTDLFYASEAIFAKWLALEAGLEVLKVAESSAEYMCIMDADILWPKDIGDFSPEKGNLYSPWRRVWNKPSPSILEEPEWGKLVRFREGEFAGYSQIFHKEDPVLGSPPWFDTRWKHAGGADSFFQKKWRPDRKIRPDWEVLHMGPVGRNWCGRSIPYMDGTIPEHSKQRADALHEILRNRRLKGARRAYEEEKLQE